MKSPSRSSRPSPSGLPRALALQGVDEIITVKVAAAEFDPDIFEAAVGALIAERRPDVVMVAHSVDSFGYAAALAAKLQLGFATDVFKVERIEGELVATRGGYGQKVNVSKSTFRAAPPCCSPMRGNVFKPPEQARIAARERVRCAGRIEPLDRARVHRIEFRAMTSTWRRPSSF